MTTENLTIGNVKEGDTLPELSYDVTATTVILGALATRDSRPMHHDVDFAVNRNGIRNIFMNTPNQAHWFERYVTDWTGPKGRLGKMRFRMKASVFPDDSMTFKGTVSGVETDEQGCSWAKLDVNLSVDGKTVTDCAVRVALPADANDNPWKRSGGEWQP
jgi:hydroxyacyl-ACP dehydratase HTD2-like protein with hotdog domain